MFRRNLPLFVMIFLFFPLTAYGQPAFAPPKEPAQGIHGALVLAGGGVIPDTVYDAFLKLAGGPKARLVIIPTAREEGEIKEAGKYLDPWKKRGAASAKLLHTRSKVKANDPEFAKLLANASGIWLEGGDRGTLVNAYRGTAVETEMRELLRRGGVIGGAAEGAAAIGHLMISGGKVSAKMDRGFGFLPGGVVEPHFLKRNRIDPLIEALSKNPGWFGLGIDDGTAIILQGRNISVLGQAIVCLAAGKDRPVSCQVLKSGDKADLVALSRSALARGQEPHPAMKGPVPNVASGALIIGGGGGLPDEVWQKFIELAGGPKSNIVCIATALDFPLKGEPTEARILKKLGAANVKTLHARTRTESDSPEFVKFLHDAGGVWFTGGRQWRFVDAYENTAAEKAFHEVLARGGVIGGSSAGASIQADYMVRGDPRGNLNIMAEGYERGLGFLKGVAIDQHFLKRKRTADMSQLMDRYPQLLGIGIDEGTALYVHGDTMEVMGKSNVLVYDPTRAPNGARDYEILPPGSRYNLRIRKAVGSR